MGFPRQEYWSGLPFPSPRDLPNLGTKPTSPASPALADGFFTTDPPRESSETPSKTQTLPLITYLIHTKYYLPQLP